MRIFLPYFFCLNKCNHLPCLLRRRAPGLFPADSFLVQATTEQAGSLSGLHVCLQGCGEVYCSSECRAEHLKRCHHLLCVGPVPEEEAETHPLVAFRVSEGNNCFGNVFDYTWYLIYYQVLGNNPLLEKMVP